MILRRSLCTLFFLCVTLTAASTDDDAAALQWIHDHAIRLKTVEAGHGFDDMEPLQKVVGDARIVALGEATHGTREFFQLKHRMLEFLATKMGFSVFAIEANMPEAYRLNDYVLNGEGDPAKLLKGMYFWTWDTQEVLDMIQWMREFNRSGKGRVQFTGFDMQAPDVAMGIVRDFVTRNDPGYLPTLRKAVDLVGRNPTDAQTAAATWKEVVEHLKITRGRYMDMGLFAWDIDWAIQNARVVMQAMLMKYGAVSRDQSMADNVKWIADRNPGAKIVVWAHNGHVAYRGWSENESMGTALHHMFGDRMVNFGFAFNQGSFQAVQMGKGLKDFTVGPAPVSSLDATLAASGIPVFALDLRVVPKDGPVSDWLHKPHQTRSIGAMYSEDGAQQYWANEDITARFDALLFVEKTTAARKNP